MLKVAAIQYPLQEGQTEQVLFAKMTRYIDEAKAQGSDLVVFPELITTELVNWQQNDVAQLHRLAEDFSPRYLEWVKSQAVAKNISILGGTTPRIVDGQIVNTAVLALPSGKLQLQNKLFLTPDEKLWGWTGGDKLNVFEAPWGKTAILICFDCEFPVVSNMLANEKPDVILVPSWTSTTAGLNRVDYTARARAVEHYAYVIKTGTIAGANATQSHFGQASIHGPQDKGLITQPVAEGRLNEDQIVYGTIDLKTMREKKATSGYYPSKEQAQRTKPLTVERN